MSVKPVLSSRKASQMKDQREDYGVRDCESLDTNGDEYKHNIPRETASLASLKSLSSDRNIRISRMASLKNVASLLDGE